MACLVTRRRRLSSSLASTQQHFLLTEPKVGMAQGASDVMTPGRRDANLDLARLALRSLPEQGGATGRGTLLPCPAGHVLVPSMHGVALLALLDPSLAPAPVMDALQQKGTQEGRDNAAPTPVHHDCSSGIREVAYLARAGHAVVLQLDYFWKGDQQRSAARRKRSSPRPTSSSDAKGAPREEGDHTVSRRQAHAPGRSDTAAQWRPGPRDDNAQRFRGILFISLTLEGILSCLAHDLFYQRAR